MFQYLLLTEPAQLGQKLQSAQFVRPSTLSPTTMEDVQALGSRPSELPVGISFRLFVHVCAYNPLV